jgi:hypothetical protein
MAFDHDAYDIIPSDITDYAETKPNSIAHIGSYNVLRVTKFNTLFTRGTTLPIGDIKTYD